VFFLHLSNYLKGNEMSRILEAKRELVKSNTELEQARDELATVLNCTDGELAEMESTRMSKAHADFKKAYMNAKKNMDKYMSAIVEEIGNELMGDDRLMNYIMEGNHTKETDYILAKVKVAMSNSIMVKRRTTTKNSEEHISEKPSYPSSKRRIGAGKGRGIPQSK